MWCGGVLTPVGPLPPGGTEEVVLAVAVFRPGTYILDDYVVDWECEVLGRRVAGTKVGTPLVLRVEAAGGGGGGGLAGGTLI